jgi:hypothetical protein
VEFEPKERLMLPQLWFFVSIAFGFAAWGIVAKRYIWPKLRLLPRAEALRPLLILHSFRFIGLAFLVPGVVSADLPSAFAYSRAPTASTHVARARGLRANARPARPSPPLLRPHPLPCV